MLTKCLRALVVGFFIASVIAPVAIAAEGDMKVKLMTKDELKSRLDDPNLVIVDVRTGRDWDASELKIKGAVRAEAKKVSELKADQEKTLVTYCA
jgi:rhodanese-related sulfurtransferase